MPKASTADLSQMFGDTVAIFKNKPYYVIRVGPDYRCIARSLLSQKEEVLPICEDTWCGPTQRLGYVNVHDACVYISRQPVRKYKAGLSKDNVDVTMMPGVEYPRGSGATKQYVSHLCSIELGQCIMGKYPTFAECLEKMKLGATAVAFDRQFAMDKRGRVFYKNKIVGKFNPRPKSIADIVFNPEYTYLVTLLENNYEKTLSIARES